MELNKETLWSVPLKRLRQTYALLSEELPKMIDEAYLDILEQLHGVLGDEAIVTAIRLDDSSFTYIEIIASSECLRPLAEILKETSEVRGFEIAFKAESCLPLLRYQITLYYLPLELDWIWNTVSPTPITLKTIVKKLKK